MDYFGTEALRNGDLLLYKGKNPFARLIQYVTESDYSHVAMVLVLHGEVCVLESRRNGVILRPLHRALAASKASIDVYRLSFIEDEHGAEMAMRGLQLLGTPYAWGDLLVQLWGVVRGKRFVTTRSSMVCSEAVASVAGLEWVDLSPGDLARMSEFVETLR